jgi:hypothetical protein
MHRGGGAGSARGLKLGFALYLAFGVGACTGADDRTLEPEVRRDVVPALAPAVLFEPPDGLRLVPGEQRSVRVRATPAGSYRMRFALLGRPDVPRDASLDRSEIMTASDGTASVLLTAPTAPTLFTLRASFDGVSGELPISVSDSGFASLAVRPHYAGQREISQWVASVHQGTTCQALSRDLGSDGPLTVQVPASQAPRIEGIPLGVQLAVRVRAGYFAFGCTELGKLAPDASNAVDVEVQDVPLKLAGARLTVSLGIDPPAVPWATSMRPAMDALLNQLRGSASDDVQALLDAMRAQVATPLSPAGFDAARSSETWDAVLRAELGSGSATALRAPVDAWMKQRLVDLTSENALSGVLQVPASPAPPTLELIRIAGLSATDAGFRALNPVAVSTKAGDTILIGANQAASSDLRLPWSPSRLLAGLAAVAARAQYPDADTLPAALAERLSCRRIAGELAANGAQSGVLFAGCDAGCGEALCSAALGALWSRIETALPATSSLSLSAVAEARIDSSARPLGFTGTWLGKLTAAGSVTSVGGAVSGGTPGVAELNF